MDMYNLLTKRSVLNHQLEIFKNKGGFTVKAENVTISGKFGEDKNLKKIISDTLILHRVMDDINGKISIRHFLYLLFSMKRVRMTMTTMTNEQGRMHNRLRKKRFHNFFYRQNDQPTKVTHRRSMPEL